VSKHTTAHDDLEERDDSHGSLLCDNLSSCQFKEPLPGVVTNCLPSDNENSPEIPVMNSNEHKMGPLPIQYSVHSLPVIPKSHLQRPIRYTFTTVYYCIATRDTYLIYQALHRHHYLYSSSTMWFNVPFIFAAVVGLSTALEDDMREAYRIGNRTKQPIINETDGSHAYYCSGFFYLPGDKEYALQDNFCDGCRTDALPGNSRMEDLCIDEWKERGHFRLKGEERRCMHIEQDVSSSRGETCNQNTPGLPCASYYILYQVGCTW